MPENRAFLSKGMAERKGFDSRSQAPETRRFRSGVLHSLLRSLSRSPAPPYPALIDGGRAGPDGDSSVSYMFDEGRR